jgi:hypothetical protein
MGDTVLSSHPGLAIIAYSTTAIQAALFHG